MIRQLFELATSKSRTGIKAALRHAVLGIVCAFAFASTTTSTARAADAVPPAAPAADASPRAVIDSLHASLISVMREAKQLGYSGRYGRLAPVLANHFDTPWMAEKSIGREWTKLGSPDRNRLVDAFRRFTTANYAGRFDGFGGERFETLRDEPSLQSTTLVYSRLLQSNGEVTELNYRLRQIEGQWRIIDVYLNGTVSELALRRSEYSSIIKRDGLDALIQALEGKIAKLKAGDVAS
jgi:phospholipid transport system substrate-binding protein